MKIWTLVENTTCRTDLQPEHGLSLYAETGRHKILFDAGQSDAFIRNADRLGVNLTEVDMAILSHGHYDHGGGLKFFLERNSKAPVYVHEKAFQPHFNGKEKYIGLDPDLQKNDRLVLVNDVLQLDEGITLYPAGWLRSRFPMDSFGLNVRENGCFYPDSFLHEQYLLVEEGEKKILFSGCSHRGILNIADCFRPDVLIGGFHFKKLDPEGAGAETLKEAAAVLMEYPSLYYTGHCTGQAQYRFLKQIMGERLSYLSTGSVLTI